MNDDETPLLIHEPAERGSSATRPDDLAPGQLLAGKYRIVVEIGRGGFGVVYDAVHQALGRRQAIKVLHRDLCPSDEARARFLQEARLIGRIGHDSIVELYDYGITKDGRPYQVMEYLPGQTLRSLLQARGRLSTAETLALFGPLCSALQAVHERDVVHRDLKASNIMLRWNGGIDQVKLLDFGIAKVLRSGASGWVTASGRVLGSPHTMAPEQIRGEDVDLRADIYALGVLLFQVLAGRPPFVAGGPGVIEQQHLHVPPPRISTQVAVDDSVDAVIATAMHKQPRRRFGNAQAFLRALTRCVDIPPRSAAENLRATALYVRVSPDFVASPERATGDGPWSLLGYIEDIARAAAMQLFRRGRLAVFGIRAFVATDPESAHAAILSAAQQVAAEGRAYGGFKLSIQVRTGTVAAQSNGVDVEYLDGALLDPTTWPAPRFDDQVHHSHDGTRSAGPYESP